MKEKTCCFTGHRIIPDSDLERVKQCLTDTIIEAISNGYRYFGAGGALGFDTLAAQTVLSLREKYPSIKLILVLPCTTQTKRWQDKDIRIYEHIMQQADKIVYVSKEYTKDCMFQRNRHLVDYSSLCICYRTKDYGGTAYTVSYAKSNGLKVINLAKCSGYNIHF